MDPLIQLLYDIPILGIVFQLVGYLIDVLPDIAPIILRGAVPIAMAALCGVMCERSGVVNIGIEGTMLVAAFAGWAAGVYLGPVFGASEATAIFGITPTLVAALGVAILAALLVTALHAWLSISVRADQIIAGMIINLAAIGITGYLYSLMTRASHTGAGAFTLFKPPEELLAIPVVGAILDMFLSQGPITMSVIVIVVVFQVFLFRSRWGLRSRSVGEHPRAAETVGIDVVRLRYRNVMIGGVLAALGGAYLSMEVTGSFTQLMTAGAGFIGLAAMIIGRWTPIGAFAAALFFSAAGAIGDSIEIAPPPDELGVLLEALPGQFFDALPYIATIIVLAGLVGRSVPPAADGQPYEREAAT